MYQEVFICDHNVCIADVDVVVALDVVVVGVADVADAVADDADINLVHAHMVHIHMLLWVLYTEQPTRARLGASYFMLATAEQVLLDCGSWTLRVCRPNYWCGSGARC